MSGATECIGNIILGRKGYDATADGASKIIPAAVSRNKKGFDRG